MIRARLVLLLALSGLLSQRLTSAQAPPPQVERHADRSKYAGDISCLACHKNLSLTYQRTSHHLTSQLPTQTSVLGSFRDGANELTIIDPARTTAEPGLKFKMEAKEEGFFETAISGWGSHLQRRSERIELITGSGVRGQTYLYWQGDRLFELP